MSSKNLNVLRLYRKTLYTMMDVFRGDYNTFHMLRITIRREIEKKRDLKDEKEIRAGVLDLEELRSNMSKEIMQVKILIK